MKIEIEIEIERYVFIIFKVRIRGYLQSEHFASEIDFVIYLYFASFSGS